MTTSFLDGGVYGFEGRCGLSVMVERLCCKIESNIVSFVFRLKTDKLTKFNCETNGKLIVKSKVQVVRRSDARRRVLPPEAQEEMTDLPRVHWFRAKPVKGKG